MFVILLIYKSLYYLFFNIINHILKDGTTIIIQGYNKFVEVGRVARINYGPQ